MANKPVGRIAVVDDTESNRYTVAHYLKRAGFEVWEAGTGRQGLELARKRPDLIVLDIKLPDIIGYDLSQMIKNDPATANIPILQISATYVNAESRVHSLEAGADAYLTWPFDAAELTANVRALLRLSKAELLAKESAERLQWILSTITDSYFVLDAQFRFKEVNRVACETFFTRSESELRGRVYWDAFPETVPSDLSREMHRAVDEENPVHSEVRSKINGRWYEVHIYPHGELLEVYLRDITERKVAEVELRFQLDLIQTITDNATSALWMLDGEGRCTFANPASEVMTGFRAAEVVGSLLHTRIHHSRPDGTPFHIDECPIMRSLRTGDIMRRQEDVFVHKDGHFFPVRYSARPVVKDGQKVATLIEVQDITEEKKARESLARAQAELQEHARDLEQAVARRTMELQESNKELEAFSYSVSHDLRAPLRAINGYASIVQKRASDRLSDEEQRFLQLVVESATQMGVLVDGLLNFSRLGRKELERMPIDMHSLFEKAIADQFEQVSRDGRSFDVRVAPDLPPAMGDLTLLRQVVVNLISNAFKFSGKNQNVEIRVEWSRDNAPPGSNCYIVRDNGVGFDMQYADKLFGVFHRLHTKQEFEGTGVGLAFSKRIIERHGGKIWARGEVGKGAQISFTLPSNGEARLKRGPAT